MNLQHRPTKLLVTGRSGTGKSTYWSRFVVGCPARLKFVFDHDGQFSARQRITPARDTEELTAAAATGWIVFEPSLIFPGRLPDAFDFFCEYAFTLSTRLAGRKLFACDEIQKLVGTARITEPLAAVLETGRVHELDAAWISIAPTLIHPRIRAQASEIVTFCQTEPNALAWLETQGFTPEAVRALAPGQFIARNVAGGETAGKVF